MPGMPCSEARRLGKTRPDVDHIGNDGVPVEVLRAPDRRLEGLL